MPTATQMNFIVLFVLNVFVDINTPLCLKHFNQSINLKFL